jgi:hypothetical protein
MIKKSAALESGVSSPCSQKIVADCSYLRTIYIQGPCLYYPLMYVYVFQEVGYFVFTFTNKINMCTISQFFEVGKNYTQNRFIILTLSFRLYKSNRTRWAEDVERIGGYKHA